MNKGLKGKMLIATIALKTKSKAQCTIQCGIFPDEFGNVPDDFEAKLAERLYANGITSILSRVIIANRNAFRGEEMDIIQIDTQETDT